MLVLLFADDIMQFPQNEFVISSGVLWLTLPEIPLASNKSPFTTSLTWITYIFYILVDLCPNTHYRTPVYDSSPVNASFYSDAFWW